MKKSSLESPFQLASHTCLVRTRELTLKDQIHSYGVITKCIVRMVSKLRASGNGFWEKLNSFFFAILQVYLFPLKQFHIPGKMANCFNGVANPVLFLDSIGRRKLADLANVERSTA